MTEMGHAPKRPASLGAPVLLKRGAWGQRCTGDSNDTGRAARCVETASPGDMGATSAVLGQETSKRRSNERPGEDFRGRQAWTWRRQDAVSLTARPVRGTLYEKVARSMGVSQ